MTNEEQGKIYTGYTMHISKEDFLKRCETIFDCGLAREDVLRLSSQWADAMIRLQGGQLDYFIDIMEQERKRTDRFSNSNTLANDSVGYKVIQLNAILTHPCQKCAEDKEAWHTRPAFCNHK